MGFHQHIKMLSHLQNSKKKGCLDKRLILEYANHVVPQLMGLEGHVAKAYRAAEQVIRTCQNQDRAEVAKLKQVKGRIATEVPALRKDVKKFIEDSYKRLKSDDLRTPEPIQDPKPMDWKEIIDFCVTATDACVGLYERLKRKV